MKLGLKLLLAPLLVAATAFVAGGTHLLVNRHESQAARAAATANIGNFKTAGNAQEQLAQVRAQVFRTLAMAASLDDAKMKAVRSDIATQVQAVQAVVAGMPAASGSDAELARLAAAAEPLLQRYLKQCDRAIDLSGTDPNVGVGAMRAAEDTYALLAQGMQAVVARTEALHHERAEQADERAWRLTMAVGALTLLMTGLALGAAWRLQRRVVTELGQALRLSEDVAQGHLGAGVTSGRDDEIGDLVRALGHMVDRLRESMQTVRGASDHIATAAQEIAAGNTDLSGRTEQAASRVQQSASSLEVLTGTVRQTADSARTANQLAASASTVAQRGGAVVAEVVATMTEINASSRRIGDIIGTIDGIAFQTNILALNAAVEAARAGEQGRGFAVVASEVRSLAQRSAEAAREIKGLIGASVERAEAGARLVADAGSTMDEIVASVQRVSDVIGEISAAAAEQSRGIGQVNDAIADLDQMTQQNAALVEQSAGAAESLRSQAQRLTTVVSGFHLGAAAAVASVAVATRRPQPAPSTQVQAQAIVARLRKPSPAAAKVAKAPAVAQATPSRPPAAAPTQAGADADWETF